MSHHYHIDSVWSDEDEACIASVPDLAGCTAHGETAAEAAHEIQVAIGLWLKSAKELGYEIPTPSYKPKSAAA